jgi:putative flippase GtrA
MIKSSNIFKKFLSREVIFYLIFGVFTTIVNITISYILKAFFNIDGNISSTIGIVCSILFAYFTNRKMVFNSSATGFKENLTEFGKFILGRLGTMIFEIIGVFFLNNVIHLLYGLLNDNTAYLINKLIITIIVVILNFFISKFFAFKK